MNKFAKLAIIVSAAFIAVPTIALAQEEVVKEAKGAIAKSDQPVNSNIISGYAGVVVKNGSDTLCWRNNYWTAGTANVGCDGSVVAKAEVPPAPEAPVAEKPAPAPAPTSQKVTYQAEALFDFDKAVLKAEGKAKIDELVEKLKDTNLEVIVATGYTDRIGSEKYNTRLSVRRAEAVKAYLVSKGLEASRVYAEGKGARDPVVTDCKTKHRKSLIECLAPNRRVQIEIVGTTK